MLYKSFNFSVFLPNTVSTINPALAIRLILGGDLFCGLGLDSAGVGMDSGLHLGDLECSEGGIVIGFGAWEGEGEEVEGEGSDGLELLLGNSRDRAVTKRDKSRKPNLMVPGGPPQVLPMENQCNFSFESGSTEREISGSHVPPGQIRYGAYQNYRWRLIGDDCERKI